MPDATKASLPTVPLIAGLVAPGLGHFLMGRRSHAALFAGCVLGLYAAGMFVSGFTAMHMEHHPVYGVMQLGAGLAAWASVFLTKGVEPLLADGVSLDWQNVGLCYCAIAGICNVMSLAELVRHQGPAPKEQG